MGEQFDDRYPAIFQPGGNELPRASAPARREDPAPEPGHPGPQRTEDPEPADVPAEQATGTPRPLWIWCVPLAAALAMLAAGIFALTAQYWLQPSMVARPANSLGVVPEPRGQRVNRATPALLSVGLGLLAASFFCFTAPGTHRDGRQDCIWRLRLARRPGRLDCPVRGCVVPRTS